MQRTGMKLAAVCDRLFADRVGKQGVEKAWSDSARAAAAEARSGGGKGSQFKGKERGADDYKDVYDRHGIGTADERGNPYGDTHSGGAISALHSNWEDAMGGTSGIHGVESEDPKAYSEVNATLKRAGIADLSSDEGTSGNNLHLAQKYDEATGRTKEMGVDSLTGKIYNTNGDHIGTMAHTKDAASLQEAWGKQNWHR